MQIDPEMMAYKMVEFYMSKGDFTSLKSHAVQNLERLYQKNPSYMQAHALEVGYDKMSDEEKAQLAVDEDFINFIDDLEIVALEADY